MMSTKTIDSITQKIQALFPKNIRELGDDLDAKLRVILTYHLNKLDLVTHEEFEIQNQVLLRTREKLSHLEEQLTQLKQQLAKKPSSEDP